MLAGLAMATGGLMLTGLTVATPLLQLLVAYGIFGVGLGLVNAPITNTAVSGMPRAQAGLAAAVASTSRQVGASLGVALAGTLAGGGIHLAHSAGFSEATRAEWWLVFGLGLAVAAIGVVSTGERAKESAKRVAFLLDAPDVAAAAGPEVSQMVTE